MTSFAYRRRVSFHETDAAGIMHFSNVLRLFEEAEHAFFRHLGTSVFQPESDGSYLSFPRVTVGSEFLRPLRFEQEVDIQVHVQALGRTSITWGFAVVDTQGETAARGTMKVVCSRHDSHTDGLRPVPVPEGLRSVLTPYVVSVP